MRAVALLMLAGCGRINFDPLGAIAQVGVGSDHSCARVGGRVACWGANNEGQLGRGDTLADPSVRWVPELPAIEYLAVVNDSTFAIDRDGAIWSWGHAGDYALGEQLPAPRLSPGRSPSLDDIVQISGGTGVCARTSAGAVTCWGDGDAGQLAIGSAPDATPPMPTVLSDVETISIGTDHGCAIAHGELTCFGSDAFGQLGVDVALALDSCKAVDNTIVPCSIAPVVVPNVVAPRAIAAGRVHTCAVFADRLVRCWGSNLDGALGDGTTTDSVVPVRAQGLGPATAVVASRHHSCALLVDGSAWCWGRNAEGELGNSDVASSAVPVRVAVPVALRSIVTEQSNYHSCAVDVHDDIWCWGNNEQGQLGFVGPSSATPVRITLPAGD